MSKILVNAPCPGCSVIFSARIPLVQDFGARSETLLKTVSVGCKHCAAEIFLGVRVSIRTGITLRPFPDEVMS